MKSRGLQKIRTIISAWLQKNAAKRGRDTIDTLLYNTIQNFYSVKILRKLEPNCILKKQCRNRMEFESLAVNK